MVPKRWGGHELGFDTLFRTTVEIAKADPSAGWCYTLLARPFMDGFILPRRSTA